jgi:hypothetical protein
MCVIELPDRSRIMGDERKQRDRDEREQQRPKRG